MAWPLVHTCTGRSVRLWNADYWYQRAGRGFHRAELAEEWDALVEGLLGPQFFQEL